MRTRRELPPGLGESFSVARARADGVSRGRLRGADLVSTAHGARSRIVAAPDTGLPPAARERDRVLARARELATVLAPHAFFAGPTAAVIHGIPLPAFHHSLPAARGSDGPAELAPLVVGVHKPRSVVRRANVRGIHIDPALAPVIEIGGLRVTEPGSTWAMLGRRLAEGDLVIAADHLLRIPRHPGGFRPPERPAFATRDQLAAAIGRRRGAEKLRRALARARTGASSPFETRLRLTIVDGGLPEPRLDYDVIAPDGAFVACLDLAYPEAQVGIEYDGAGHRTQTQFERDIAKVEWLRDLGWDIVRVTAADFRDHLRESRIVPRVRAAIARQATRKV